MHWGLVNRVVEVGSAREAARAIASTIVARGPLSNRLAKKLVDAAQDVALDAVLSMSTVAQQQIFDSDDLHEGAAAFFAKRDAAVHRAMIMDVHSVQAEDSVGRDSPPGSALLGRGAVVIWNDVAPEGRDQFYAWHDNEHIPERLAIPGFRRGRRFISPSHSPEWLTLYEADDLSVVTSTPYLARLNAPTPATVSALEHFRNTSRAACTRRALVRREHRRPYAGNATRCSGVEPAIRCAAMFATRRFRD